MSIIIQVTDDARAVLYGVDLDALVAAGLVQRGGRRTPLGRSVADYLKARADYHNRVEGRIP